MEESCCYQQNPLVNLSIIKSEATRNNALKYGEVKRKWAWDLLQNTSAKIVTTTKTTKVVDESVAKC